MAFLRTHSFQMCRIALIGLGVHQTAQSPDHVPLLGYSIQIRENVIGKVTLAAFDVRPHSPFKVHPSQDHVCYLFVALMALQVNMHAKVVYVSIQLLNNVMYQQMFHVTMCLLVLPIFLQAK
jgi:hypothetical protein